MAHRLDRRQHGVACRGERLPGRVAPDVDALALGLGGGREGGVADGGALAPEPAGGRDPRDEAEPVGVGAGAVSEVLAGRGDDRPERPAAGKLRVGAAGDDLEDVLDAVEGEHRRGELGPGRAGDKAGRAGVADGLGDENALAELVEQLARRRAGTGVPCSSGSTTSPGRQPSPSRTGSGHRRR